MRKSSPTDKYSLQRRNEIRREIIAYSEEHGIGVIKLIQNIRESSPRKETIPVKTMQNFIGNLRKTNDGLIGMCERFLERVKAQKVGGRAALGVSLSSYLGAGRESDDLSGDYTVRKSESIGVLRDLVSHTGLAMCAEYYWMTERDQRSGNIVFDGVLSMTRLHGIAVLRHAVKPLVITYHLTRRQASDFQGVLVAQDTINLQFIPTTVSFSREDGPK